MRLHYFKQFLNFFWLRPENALLLALRAESYNSTLKFFGEGKDAIDVSCGDGVFSFITLGGELSENTDMFRAVNTQSTFRSGNFDTFDYFDDTYYVKIKKKPDKFYEYGCDWKENLLKKAAKLNSYKNLFLHDNNYKINLPDNTMKYIYTNSSYWVRNFENHIIDLIRLLKKNGYLILQIKTKSIINFTSKKYIPFMGEEFHKIIDAGRLSTYKGLKSKDEIIQFLRGIDNINIHDIKPIYGDIMAKIWDIGLRPLYNPLVKMANSLSDNKRLEIKTEWCEIFYKLLYEYLLEYKSSEENAIEYLIIIEKK